MVIPNVLAFGTSIEHGFKLVTWFYPWPQNSQAFYSSPNLIRGHIGVSLSLSLPLVSWDWSSMSNPCVCVCYCVSVII